MGIETKYKYIYYTILDDKGIFELLGEADTMDEMMDTLTTNERVTIWINSLNKVLKNNNDYTVNNFRVDETRYCDDIKQWCSYSKQQSKQCPVFVQYNDKQPIKVEGEGYMFHLYEKNDDDDDDDDEDDNSDSPDCYYGYIDGLAGAGGRL
jgi:hypothetical protein